MSSLEERALNEADARRSLVVMEEGVSRRCFYERGREGVGEIGKRWARNSGRFLAKVERWCGRIGRCTMTCFPMRKVVISCSIYILFSIVV